MRRSSGDINLTMNPIVRRTTNMAVMVGGEGKGMVTAMISGSWIHIITIKELAGKK
jgi:hypothetical protein